MLKNMQKYGGLYFLGALQLLLYGAAVMNTLF